MLQFKQYRKNVWRVIEGQYRPSTLQIVDTLDEQMILEELLDDTKPKVPKECKHLSYHFSTPFRYGRYPGPSRFRREGLTPGVYYAAEDPLTAALEAAWGTVKFFRASPGTSLPAKPTTHTAIQAAIDAPFAIDLTDPDISGGGDWMNPTDYSHCLELADEAREQGCEAIRYQSIRDPTGGANVAVLTCQAFSQPEPLETQTWHMLFKQDRVILENETLRQSHEFLTWNDGFKPTSGQ